MERITVKITVHAGIDKVWKYWTEPEHIIHWNFASDTWHCPSAKNDLRPQGTFSWRMEAKDGSMGFDFEGTYDKIIEKELISYSMPDGRGVMITFVEQGNQVTVSETFDAERTHSDQQQREGWQAILGNFNKYVESR